MNHVTEYEQYDEAKYIGKPIDEHIFKTEKSELLLLKIYDNKTYTIDFYIRGTREYKHVNIVSLDVNVPEFNRIDPEFGPWLTAQLQKHYEL
jgi:hypothetical protein